MDIQNITVDQLDLSTELTNRVELNELGDLIIDGENTYVNYRVFSISSVSRLMDEISFLRFSIRMWVSQRHNMLTDHDRLERRNLGLHQLQSNTN